MQKKTTKMFLVLVASLFATSFMSGCAHMEKSPPERHTGYAYIHMPLPEASRKVDEARTAGKEKECPAEFMAASNTVDKAYEVYKVCHTQEGIALAQEGINKLNVLCPPIASLPAAPISVKQQKIVVFNAIALFDFDKSVLKPEGKRQIKAYREDAKDELSRTDKIKITGYTDNIGSANYNVKLSQRRAETVRKYLVSLGVDAGKLEVKGEGMSNPVADNSTKAGRAKNRRVEVELIGLEK